MDVKLDAIIAEIARTLDFSLLMHDPRVRGLAETSKDALCHEVPSRSWHYKRRKVRREKGSALATVAAFRKKLRCEGSWNTGRDRADRGTNSNLDACR